MNITTKSGRLHGLVLSPPNCGEVLAGHTKWFGAYEVTELSDVGRSRRGETSSEPAPVRENPPGDCLPAATAEEDRMRLRVGRAAGCSGW